MTEAESTIRACSFNVRYDAPDDEHSWTERRPRIVETVRDLEPDLLGVQEALSHQYDDLRSDLGAYEWIGVGRRDGDREGEFVPIAWRADRFERLETGAFWLSETPAEPSVGWDAALPRVSTWATLRERETGSRWWVCNTHFDHVGDRARLESARLLRRRAGRRLEDGFTPVVTGDLNCLPDSSPYRALTDDTLEDARVDVADVRGPEGTFHGFSDELEDRIDYVLAAPSKRVDRYRALEPASDGYRSDHVPVVATLQREL